MTGTAGGESQEPSLKSKKSVQFSFLRFTNQTQRRVNIVWVNYEGCRVTFKTLTPQQFVDINTFVGHPWIFFDADTGDKMVVQLKEIFEPTPWDEVSRTWPPQRKVINITIPIYSLQECCLQALRNIVPRHRIDELELPEILKDDLQRKFRSTSLRRQNALTS